MKWTIGKKMFLMDAGIVLTLGTLSGVIYRTNSQTRLNFCGIGHPQTKNNGLK